MADSMSLERMHESLVELINRNHVELTNEIKVIKLVDEKVDSAIDRINKLEQASSKRDEEIIMLKKSVNRNNVIIYGFHNYESDEICLEDRLIKFFKEKLKVEITPEDIDFAYKLGKREANGPIKVGLSNLTVKNCIMGNKKSLKELNLNIYINEDLPLEIRAKNALLRKKKRNEQESNKKRYRQASSEESSPTSYRENKKIHTDQNNLDQSKNE